MMKMILYVVDNDSSIGVEKKADTYVGIRYSLISVKYEREKIFSQQMRETRMFADTNENDKMYNSIM